jgi:hypothetical protein
MADLQEILSAAEVAAGAAYAKLVGTYQDVNGWTAAHPEVTEGVRIATALLRAAGVDVSAEIKLAEIIWGRIGVLLALDPTVQGPTIGPAREPA